MEPIVNPVYEYSVTRRKIADVQFQLGNGPKEWFPQVGSFVKLVRPFFEDLDHERLVAAYFNSGGQLTGLQVLAEGGATSVEIEPVALLRAAIAADARLVILVHNHPNGTLIPSDNDVTLVGNQIQQLNMFNIVLVDSVIVNDSGFLSIRMDEKRRRHEAIVKGEYVPEASDYNLSDPDDRALCASELRLSAGLQVDPNLAEALRVTALTIEGKMHPMEAMMKIEALHARSQMRFDPNGEDGPERLN